MAERPRRGGRLGSGTATGVVITVSAASTATEVTGPDGAAAGEEATLTATVEPADAAGKVTFFVDGTAATTVDVDSGAASAPYTFESEGDASVVATFEPADPSSYGSSTSPIRPVRVVPGASSEWAYTSPFGMDISMGSGCKVAGQVGPASRGPVGSRDGDDDLWNWFGAIPPFGSFSPFVFNFAPVGFGLPFFVNFSSIHFEACILGLGIGHRARETATTVSGEIQCLPTATGYTCPFELPAFSGFMATGVMPLPAGYAGRKVTMTSTLASIDPLTGAETTVSTREDTIKAPQRTALSARLAPVKSNLTSVERGATVAYRLLVRNAGVVTADRVRACVSLGKGAEVVAAKGAVVHGRQACWKLPDLKKGRSANRSIILRAPQQRGPLTIVANVVPRRSQADPVRLTTVLPVR